MVVRWAGPPEVEALARPGGAVVVGVAVAAAQEADRLLGAAAEVAWVNRARDRRISLGETWSEWMGRDARFLAVSGSGQSGAR